MRLQNLTIKTRLLLLVGMAILLMVAIGTMGLNGMRNTSQSLNSVYQDRLTPTGAIGSIAYLLQENRTELLLSLQHDPDSAFSALHNHPLEQHLKQAEANTRFMSELWKEYLSTQQTEQEKKLAEDFYSKRMALIENGVKPIMALLRAGSYYEANKLLLDRVNPGYIELGQAIEKLQQIQLDIAKAEY